MYDIAQLRSKKVVELREIAAELKLKKVDKLKKDDLVYKILDEQAIVSAAEVSKPKPKRVRTPLNAKLASSDKKQPVKSPVNKEIKKTAVVTEAKEEAPKSEQIKPRQPRK
jgi:transcription termination factor Rho